jgi:hypothetical protein
LLLHPSQLEESRAPYPNVLRFLWDAFAGSLHGAPAQDYPGAGERPGRMSFFVRQTRPLAAIAVVDRSVMDAGLRRPSFFDATAEQRDRM